MGRKIISKYGYWLGVGEQGDHATGKPGNIREFVKRVKISGNLNVNLGQSFFLYLFYELLTS